MKKYVINSIKSEKYDCLLTILDYQVEIDDCLKEIDREKYKNILIDELIKAGVDSRFVAVDEQGNKKDTYVTVEELMKADEVLRVNRDMITYSSIAEKINRI